MNVCKIDFGQNYFFFVTYSEIEVEAKSILPNNN